MTAHDDTPPPPDWVHAAIELRIAHWNEHPIVTAGAKLPIPSIKEAVAITMAAAVHRRSSRAWWSHPGTGKSSCIEVLQEHIATTFPGAGVFVYEAKASEKDDEGKVRERSAATEEREFLRDLLEEMDYEGRIESELPARRRQLRKALISLAQPRRHLFLVIDEGQELTQRQLKWLKTSVNKVVASGCRVTTLLFGQVELLAHRDKIVSEFRSDLDLRFTRMLLELKGICSADDLREALAACDEASEYPLGSGLTYTQFLFPLAFSNGFRLVSIHTNLWAEFKKASPLRSGESGIAMEHVAMALSALVQLLRDQDSPELEVSADILREAVKASGYAQRKSVRPAKSR